MAIIASKAAEKKSRNCGACGSSSSQCAQCTSFPYGQLLRQQAQASKAVAVGRHARLQLRVRASKTPACASAAAICSTKDHRTRINQARLPSGDPQTPRRCRAPRCPGLCSTLRARPRRTSCLCALPSQMAPAGSSLPLASVLHMRRSAKTGRSCPCGEQLPFSFHPSQGHSCQEDLIAISWVRSCQ
jgi:hypothetical protein